MSFDATRRAADAVAPAVVNINTESTLRPRSVEEKGAIARALREKVWPLLESGRVRPVIFATFPLAEAAAAHRLMESSRHIGKIVLRVESVERR